LCLPVLLAGCAANERCELLNSDFEQFTGWVSSLPEFLTTEQAHSGRYSYRMAAGTEFGPSYTTTFERCGFMPKRLKLSAWAYLPSGRVRANVVVVTVDCHGRRPNLWKGMNLDEVVTRYQLWVPVQKHITLPDDLLPTDELKVYLWRAEKDGELLFLDDLKLEGWQ
jgi:hypothetical protein